MGEKFEKITTRTIFIIILLPIILLIIHFGGILYYAAVAFLAILSFWELRCIAKHKGYQTSLLLGIVLTLLFLYTQNLSILFSYNLVKKVFTLLLFSIIFEQFFLKNKSNSIMNICLTIFTSIYIGHLMSFFLSIIDLGNGKLLLIFVLLITWVNDMVAYLFGIKFGKHHPFPYISPNKTIEGSVAGVFGGAVFALLFSPFLPFKIPLLIFLGIITSVSGQIGDLFESLLKRNFMVKDSGKIIPGHGGILDCIDSILFSTPILYYIFKTIL